MRGNGGILSRGALPVAIALARRVHPDHLLMAVAHLDRPVLVRHLGHTIVAACPDEVATGASVWDALRRPPAHTGAAHPMAGGWIGLLADRLAGTVELLPGSPPDEAGPPAGDIARYPAVIVVDDEGSATLVAERDGPEVAALMAAVADARPLPLAPPPRSCVRSSLPGAMYEAAVEQARALIRAGDVYQVNVVQRLDAEWNAGPLPLARALWDAAGPAPHRAYLDLPEGTVVSASPERLVAGDGRTVWSEPIKGTAAPGAYGELATSVKDRAEHVMIVDLVRNDLGRIAVPGGVSVPTLMGPLSTAYADHMVSRVSARLTDDAGPADVLRAVFPAGSVTGAPKVRALEVIREIEPVGRGPAFGSVVAVGTDGSLDASVTIRTAWVPRGVPRAHYWCGGAVVWDSHPVAEREEAWRKAAPFLAAIGAHP
jgi:anthranilate/para-aminobenzoate synthase component I